MRGLWVLLIATLPLILVFQNCSEVHVTPAPQVVLASRADAYFKATACPKAEILPAESTKFLFVIDMSISNIGDWRFEGDWAYFVPDKNTDRVGARFQAIKDFINTCGNQVGNQFAVIAFASTAGSVMDIEINPSTGAKSFRCTGEFGTKDQAISAIDALKKIQDNEIPDYDRWVSRPVTASYRPGLLGGTNYNEGLKCVEDMVVNDLTNPISALQAKNYQVFFVSDGAPADWPGTFCEDKTKYVTAQDRENCYLQGIESHVSFTMQAALGKIKNMKYHAIYYNQGTTDTAEATLIQKYMGLIARLGDTGTPSFLGRFSEALASGKNPLCDLLGVRGSIEYRPDVMTLVNLSAKRVNGRLEPDSDLDGLSDQEEEALGWESINPRSQVPDVLDGICQRVGGKAACQSIRSGFNCSTTENALGLNECDLKVLQIHNLYAHPTPGIDSDKDGMPDVVEIIKGTDPGLIDMHQDPDADYSANRIEILQNRNPFVPDANVQENEKPVFNIQYMGTAAGTCPYGAWQMTSSTLPGVLGQAFSSSTSTFQHAENENVYLIYYRSNPTNSGQNAVEYYTYLLRVAYSKDKDGNITVTPSKLEILPSDFVKAGEVEP